MRRYVFAVCVVSSSLLATPPAHAIGCFSGAMAGAVAGHMAGHGILGAIGGCFAGHAYHKHQLNQQAYQTRDDYVRQRQQADPTFQDPWNKNSPTTK
jgi:uncharacterized protein YcfJ